MRGVWNSRPREPYTLLPSVDRTRARIHYIDTNLQLGKSVPNKLHLYLAFSRGVVGVESFRCRNIAPCGNIYPTDTLLIKKHAPDYDVQQYAPMNTPPMVKKRRNEFAPPSSVQILQHLLRAYPIPVIVRRGTLATRAPPPALDRSTSLPAPRGRAPRDRRRGRHHRRRRRRLVGCAPIDTVFSAARAAVIVAFLSRPSPGGGGHAEA